MGGRRPACFVTQQQQVSSWCCNPWQHERSTCPTCCRCVAWHRRQSLDHGGKGKEQPPPDWHNDALPLHMCRLPHLQCLSSRLANSWPPWDGSLLSILLLFNVSQAGCDSCTSPGAVQCSAVPISPGAVQCSAPRQGQCSAVPRCSGQSASCPPRALHACARCCLPGGQRVGPGMSLVSGALCS